MPLWLAHYVEAAAKADRRSVGAFVTNAVLDQIATSETDEKIRLCKEVVRAIKKLGDDKAAQTESLLAFIGFCMGSLILF